MISSRISLFKRYLDGLLPVKCVFNISRILRR